MSAVVVMVLGVGCCACRFMYGTRTAGVTEAYSTIDFYRANFDSDAPRVHSLFKVTDR